MLNQLLQKEQINFLTKNIIIWLGCIRPFLNIGYPIINEIKNAYKTYKNDAKNKIFKKVKKFFSLKILLFKIKDK